MDSPIPTLMSERLTLRPFIPADATHVFELMKDPLISKTTLNVAWPYPLSAAEGWISTHQAVAEAGTGYTWAIDLNGELVGAIAMMNVNHTHHHATLGYWLGVPYWNLGIMTEAAKLVIDFGFDTLNLYRIAATCMPENRGSSRVMEKNGMQFEGISRGNFYKDGKPRDSANYAIIRPDRQ